MATADTECVTLRLGQDGVDQADYALWKNNYGAVAGAGSGAAVPEPASFLLFLVGCLVLNRGWHLTVSGGLNAVFCQ